MNVFRKIYYFFADVVFEVKDLQRRWRQWFCGKIGHEWGEPQRISYNPKTGHKETMRVCVNCGKVKYKVKKVAVNYGKGNPKQPKWNRYLTNM